MHGDKSPADWPHRTYALKFSVMMLRGWLQPSSLQVFLCKLIFKTGPPALAGADHGNMIKLFLVQSKLDHMGSETMTLALLSEL